MPLEHPAEEIKRLQRCINDLISVIALPAIWTGGQPYEIVGTLADVLLSMLRLDLACVRLKDATGVGPMEMIRIGQQAKLTAGPQEISEMLDRWLGDEPQKWPDLVRNRIGDQNISIAPLPLGLNGELGLFVAGSEREDFPNRTEKLLLTVAANQAAIGLQAAWLLSEQKRVAGELDRRVTDRTAELAAANAELKKEVAERKLAEEKLRLEEVELKRSEAFLTEAQRLSSTGSFSWRVATDEIIWSEQLYRIFEFDRSVPVTLELIATRFNPEDSPLWHDANGRARRYGSDFEFEHRVQIIGGPIKYLHVVAHATHGENGELEYIGAIQEVTERRLAEAALSKIRSELAQAVRATSFGVMTASIAHEVNQPLSGIVTNAGTCLRMLGAEPPNVEGARETAKRTIRDANRASEVVTRLRALFAKKSTGTESVDLNEAAREVIALLSNELQGSRVIIRLEVAGDLPLITGDRVQLQQVILNLIRNASDAMKYIEGHPRLLRIKTERDDGDHVRLTVQDAGVGFEPKDLNKLFEAFYSTKSDGMGIGLSVSRSIIESHSGRLWATANDGPGATFAFSVPCRAEQL